MIFQGVLWPLQRTSAQQDSGMRKTDKVEVLSSRLQLLLLLFRTAEPVSVISCFGGGLEINKTTQVSMAISQHPSLLQRCSAQTSAHG